MAIDFTLAPEHEEIRLRVREFITDVVKPREEDLASAGDDWTIRLWNVADPQAKPQVLHGHEAAHGYAVTENRVRGFLGEAALPCLDQLAASFGFQGAGAAAEHEIAQGDLAIVHGSQHDGIAQ